MRSSRKPVFFKKKNEAKKEKLMPLQQALIKKDYEAAKNLLAANHELYDMTRQDFTDSDENHFPAISIFAYLLWRRDIEGINVFMHACDEMPTKLQHYSLTQVEKELKSFKQSGTVVIINNEKHNKHRGLDSNPAKIDINDLITQVSARAEVLRQQIVNGEVEKLMPSHATPRMK